MSESAPPQPGPPPDSESGRESDDIERDAGVDAWKHHASRDEPRHAGTPSSEFSDEPVAPPAQDDPSDSG